MNKPKLKIMWVSNSIYSPSGYSNVSRDMYQNFRENGWTPETFAFIDMYGLQGGIQTDEFGFKHYPIMDHQFGSDAMLHHSRSWGADAVISLLDIWPQNPQDLSQLPRWIPWVPIDYDPAPKPILSNLRFANRIISMSEFGGKQLQENGFSSTLIPHGVNTKIFFPMDKKKRKMEVNIDPNTFIFGMVSANKEAVNPRKAFQQHMEAFARFLNNHPNSLLYIHTDPDFPGGFPLKQFADFLGITQRVVYPERYRQKYLTSKQEMNLIYNTFDCLLSASSSEGFCIPVIEAQACGVPVIVNDWTSMPEMVQDGVTGYITKADDRLKIYYPVGSYFQIPDRDQIYEKMVRVQGMRIEKMGISARKWIMDNYDQDMLFTTKWMPLLEKLEKEIYGEQSQQLTLPQATV